MTRLVMLTGPGGVGKTRLAIAVASSVRTGFDIVAFVPLAPVSDPDLVATAIARSIGLPSSEKSIVESLRDYCGRSRLLLVLDNVEHLLDAGPMIVDLLGGCPTLTVLATSRALLRVSAETVVPVAPLAVPDRTEVVTASSIAQVDAVALFVDRGRAARADFALTDTNASDVLEICRRLDGLPLAIELAAARITILTPRLLLDRLKRRLPLLTDGPRDRPERLQTMRAGIGWSYDLLSADEQTLFRYLGVFPGGCTLTAAEAIGSSLSTSTVDVITGLVDKSLLLRPAPDDDSGPRFTMLETIREYAIEQLELHGEDGEARRAHAGYFHRLAEQARSGLRGAEQQRWRDVLEADLDNLRAALVWTLGPVSGAPDHEIGLQLVGALWYFWFQRGLASEGRRWLAQALGQTTSRGSARAEALVGAGTLTWRQGDCAAARTHLDESVALWREQGDHHGLAEALHVLGHVRFDQRAYADARVLFEESLAEFQSANDTLGGLPLRGDLGLVSYHEGDYGTAERVYRESLALYRVYGLTDRIAGALNGLGDLAQVAGDYRRAADLYTESLTLWRQLRGGPGIASALHKLGQVSRRQQDNATARALFVESLLLQQELGNKQGIAECLAGLAATATGSGRPDRAAEIFAASAALLGEIGVPLAPVDQLALTADMDATRRLLGSRGWDSRWSFGSALSNEDAISLALAEGAAAAAAVGGRPSRSELSPLSRRETEISQLLADGLTNRQISRQLSITEKTVGSHIEHIMTKLDLRSRTRIAVWAAENGLRGARPD